jgi:hypothetical protein
MADAASGVRGEHDEEYATIRGTVLARVTDVNSGPNLTPWLRLKSDPFGSFVRPAACW